MYANIATASLVGLSCLSTLASAVPFSFPLANGFPKPSAAQLATIEAKAHGSLPNGGPPPSITNNTLTSLQFVAFNELFEVAYFTELIGNITNNVDGYRIQDGAARSFILKTLINVQAQEELHQLNANGAVAHFGHPAIEPCKYDFPVTNFEDAIALAATFTDLTIGTLTDVVSLFGSDGDSGLIKGVAAVIGQEGEQNGYYRSLQGKAPSALPFLTSATREFAFSGLNQLFIVPGSCPNSNLIDLPIFKPLTVLSTASHAVENKRVKFSISADSYKLAGNSTTLSVVYINQQNLPIVENIENITATAWDITFEAAFPFDEATFGNGLTIAAITNSTGPFTSPDAVAAKTLFGPGLIEIN